MQPSLNLNTFSIVAWDPRSVMFGVAVSTKVPAVGVLVPYARSGVGVIATQALVNHLLGYDGLDLLERAHSAEETLEILLNSDSQRCALVLNPQYCTAVLIVPSSS